MKLHVLSSLLIGLVITLLSSTAAGQRTSIVDLNSAGTGGGSNGAESPYLPSADGRFIAFVSGSSDLVPNDFNGTADVFVRDTVTRTTTLVSANYAGTSTGNYISGSVSAISPDGRFVIFGSQSSDLVLNDNNGNSPVDLFLRDVTTGTTTLITLGSTGPGGTNHNTLHGSFSRDGRFILLLSQASNLGPTDNNGDLGDIFVYEISTGTLTLVSINNSGTGTGNGGSTDDAISANGRFVIFESTASDLVANDTNGFLHDVFVRDLVTGTTKLVSSNYAGNGSANGDSIQPVMSPDGRFIAFKSDATDLVNNGTNDFFNDVFVRDMTTGVTTLVSVNSSGNGSGNGVSSDPTISSNGRIVTFSSNATNLVSGDSSPLTDIYSRDLLTGVTTLVSVSTTGTGSDHSSTFHSASDDGRFVAFRSTAKNLTPMSIAGTSFQVFVRDLATGTTTLASVNSTGNGGGNNNSYIPRVSANGRVVVFSSFATNLVSDDINSRQDVFAFVEARTSGDYDGDGKTDSAVWNPTSGFWSVMGSFDNVTRTQAWGLSSLGDQPVSGDYDGDGRVDLAVFRSSDSTWYILQTSTNSLKSEQWGNSTDRPVPADYDGDGKTDVAVFRPSEGTWYILQSRTNSYRAQSFGASGDELVPGDYDADGKADLAVFRPSEGVWYVLNSSDDSLKATAWGANMDKVVPADYDGDGKLDLAVFRPGDQTWYILNSSNNASRAEHFGLATDIPIPGEYDGDGKADLAVFRQGDWYVMQSATNILKAYHLGGDGEEPVSSSPF